MGRQVIVAVNEYVDEQVAPLVKALSAFDKVWSFSSFRDKDGWIGLSFEYGVAETTTIEEVATFANRLAQMIDKYGGDSLPVTGLTVSAETHISIEWWCNRKPIISMRLPSQYLPEVVTTLTSASREFASSSNDKRP